MTRASGILLHPVSLPGPYGIGDIGKNSRFFVDWLANASQTLWQVLPLGPTGYGDSPYASFSTFAGNPLLIGIDDLLDEGYLEQTDLEGQALSNVTRIDYATLIPWKQSLICKAADRFIERACIEKKTAYNSFKKENSWWLDDYSLFMDIKEYYDSISIRSGIKGSIWSNSWPIDLALRKEDAIHTWRTSPDHERSIERKNIIQFFFFSQWFALKKYAMDKNIRIIGDIPIFVAPDSVDVWSNKELFQLNAKGEPLSVAGVPPDYFSATGQLWGNPLFNWQRLKEFDYAWWIRRIKHTLTMVDLVRIDHFRGFDAYWSVPYGYSTAETGTWLPGPGMDFFSKLKESIDPLPILAEDLGVITESVRALRDNFNFPGMKILQFAFDSKESGKGIDTSNTFLPHMYTSNSVVYTGTHDNDTTAGWLSKANKKEKAFLKHYLGGKRSNYLKEMIRLAFASVSSFAIIPMQDILGLGSEARMNTPSTLGGNWSWRLEAKDLDPISASLLKDLSETYARNSI